MCIRDSSSGGKPLKATPLRHLLKREGEGGGLRSTPREVAGPQGYSGALPQNLNGQTLRAGAGGAGAGGRAG
eukprot:15439479-Alexandrium_andersonii.AAC.1